MTFAQQSQLSSLSSRPRNYPVPPSDGRPTLLSPPRESSPALPPRDRKSPTLPTRAVTRSKRWLGPPPILSAPRDQLGRSPLGDSCLAERSRNPRALHLVARVTARDFVGVSAEATAGLVARPRAGVGARLRASGFASWRVVATGHIRELLLAEGRDGAPLENKSPLGGGDLGRSALGSLGLHPCFLNFRKIESAVPVAGVWRGQLRNGVSTTPDPRPLQAQRKAERAVLPASSKVVLAALS